MLLKHHPVVVSCRGLSEFIIRPEHPPPTCSHIGEKRHLKKLIDQLSRNFKFKNTVFDSALCHLCICGAIHFNCV